MLEHESGVQLHSQVVDDPLYCEPCWFDCVASILPSRIVGFAKQTILQLGQSLVFAVWVTNHTEDVATGSGESSRLRYFGFRVSAVLLGLLLLPVVELVLGLLGWGDPQQAYDPFVGFRSTRPLFVRNDEKSCYETAANRLKFFRPESFSASKSPTEFRVFCLGGSTVQGRPFKIETSFTTWLEISLQAADPSRQWQVVNCGGISYASYRLVPILREVLDYQPDLVVLYTGHNEFLEDRTYDHIKIIRRCWPRLSMWRPGFARLRCCVASRCVP